ncbi:GtrA family protein [Ruegeria marisrubri]|jgi:putative flippase GtrA|uniref:GtrA family protein n=1 Tax=Ruegeria TaxID=97050 RepID=UPI0014808F0F|nr:MULTISPECIES: GtrA family protein [Ruegeria]MCA0908498.1 GtrA family protein [Ruegeria marisrubri]NOC85794.1 GtrA family protein [Ruegeria sp. HKCCD6428]NOD86256.1 GtrA family protein [Ruegeria sp. HKCCD6119]NOE28387.1 GtrA family protein [Ruegeria sp. HKCCD6157]
MKSSSFLRKQSFMLFALVGIVNTAFGYAVFSVLSLSGLPAQAALAISFVIGVLWNFMTHARIVFDTKGFRKLPFYLLAYVMVYVFNAFSLEALLSTGLHPILAQGLLVLPAAVLAFILVSRALTDRFPWQQEV